MSFKPLNRHILIFPAEKQEPDNPGTILVPDDYIKVKSPYEIYRVVDVAVDCERVCNENIGHQIVVNNSMVEEIKVHGRTHYLLLENYVYGILSNSEE